MSNLDVFLKIQDEQYQTVEMLDLTCIDLNAVDEERFLKFCQMLKKCTRLNTLNLQQTNLGECTRTRVLMVCQAIAPCSSLYLLNLTGNHLSLLDDDCVAALGAAISLGKSLQVLNLSINDLTCSKKWGNVLLECLALQSLSLRACSITSNSACLHEWGVILTQCKNLQVLSIEYISRDILNEPFMLCCQKLAQCENLKILNLEIGNIHALDVVHWRILSKALANFKNLHVFNLTCRGLTLNTICLQALEETLVQCAGVPKLTLSFTTDQVPLTREYLKALGNLCAQCIGLKTLSLFLIGLHKLDDEHFNAFYEMISKCETLIHIVNLEFFSETQQTALRKIFIRNQRVIDNIQQVLTNVFPIKCVDAQQIVIQYILPQYQLLKTNKTASTIALSSKERVFCDR